MSRPGTAALYSPGDPLPPAAVSRDRDGGRASAAGMASWSRPWAALHGQHTQTAPRRIALALPFCFQHHVLPLAVKGTQCVRCHLIMLVTSFCIPWVLLGHREVSRGWSSIAALCWAWLGLSAMKPCAARHPAVFRCWYAFPTPEEGNARLTPGPQAVTGTRVLVQDANVYTG